jgi:peptidoglycan/xylan/chitin deacetylase (PgdA/CDA1 family)
MMCDLYAANTPGALWRLLLEPTASALEWATAARAATAILPLSDAAGGDVQRAVAAILGEAPFGPNRWQLSRDAQLYYQMKRLLPHALRLFLRRRYRRHQEGRFPLAWPIEDRYVQFQFHCMANLMRQRGQDCAPYIGIWPRGHRFALVLTHDIESARGQAFVREVADLEEHLGFRSAFNFVPERYPIDHALMHDLRRRGFEIGLHGLEHDDKLFSSRGAFDQRAPRINQYAQDWGVVGFRAPYMHRNPEWMQALEIEYDSSFFDTDPYEPMPGGTMSIWPFFLGHFVELPYTLAQDHTLSVILGERTPRLWLDKVDFIEQWHGMALLNTHPDYLREPRCLAIYEAFLCAMKERTTYWHALPRHVAQWWRQRATVHVPQRDGQWDLSGLPGAAPAHFCITGAGPAGREEFTLTSACGGGESTIQVAPAPAR